MKAAPSTVPEYAEAYGAQLDFLASEDQAQPGDPAKLVKIILDLVRREGVAEGREIPLRLPLGADVYSDIKAKCEKMLELLGEWESIIQSTDYEDDE